MDDNDTTYHALDSSEVLERLESDPQGLSDEEVRKRRERYGSNVLREEKQRGAGRILLDQFKSIVVLLLLAAAVAAFTTARWPEGLALVAVTLLNTLIGFFSEWRAVRSMAALRELARHETRVRRDQEEQPVDAEQLVPGDIVLLQTGDLVPADVRVIEADQLRLNEAPLTGESVPVDKTATPNERDTPLAERTSMVYSGSTIVDGRGEGVVVATGMQTELGRISQLVQEAEAQETPLQEKLDRLASRLAWVTIGIAVVVAIAGLASGRDLLLMIETAIALGVAAIPEGLPIVATIALARGMYLMAQRNAVVNRLTAVETLGATRVIFTDKTGTLTENRMSVRRVLTASGEHQLDGREQSDQAGRHDKLLRRVVQTGVLCNNASLSGDDGQPIGDPTEVALLEIGTAFEMPREKLLEQTPEEREEAFDPDVMMMATFHRADGGFQVAVKGAPRAVLQACTRVATEDGEDPLSDEDRDHWLDKADQLAGQGLRLLAMAERQVDSANAPPYEELTFLGLACLVDPPREEVADAVEECQRAGIRAVMVTGDRPDTGQAIGEQLGLTSGGSAIRGGDLSDLNDLDEEERRRILEAEVFARVTPQQKLELVKLYQSEGEIVAMTGDGVNDAPALKQADIGVAMGRRGTDAAKQAADMVLGDDQFATIVAAVRQGRVIFANIRKSVMFMLCTNLAEILVVTIAALAQLPIPLRPLQILYLNVLTDVLPALALGVGRGTAQVMGRPPRDPGEAVLTPRHWKAIGAWSFIINLCVLGALTLSLMWLGFDEVRAVTVSFLTLGFSKLWFVINLRDQGTKLWGNDIVRNRWIWASLVTCTGLLLLAVYWGPLAMLLETRPPGTDGWLVILGLSLVPALLGIFIRGGYFDKWDDPRRAASAR